MAELSLEQLLAKLPKSWMLWDETSAFRDEKLVDPYFCSVTLSDDNEPTAVGKTPREAVEKLLAALEGRDG